MDGATDDLLLLAIPLVVLTGIALLVVLLIVGTRQWRREGQNRAAEGRHADRR